MKKRREAYRIQVNGKLIYTTFISYVAITIGVYFFTQIQADRPAGPATTYILRHNTGGLPKLIPNSNQQILGPTFVINQ